MATLEDHLREWTRMESYELDAIAYKTSPSDVVDHASVIWPDGSTGTFTTTAFVTVDYANIATGFTVTHDSSSMLVVQPDHILSAHGLVVVEPELLITAASAAAFGGSPFGDRPFGE